SNEADRRRSASEGAARQPVLKATVTVARAADERRLAAPSPAWHAETGALGARLQRTREGQSDVRHRGLRGARRGGGLPAGWTAPPGVPRLRLGRDRRDHA